MIQIYTGNGKGKTTAALGLCYRAAGHGLKSAIFFFMKGDIRYGELVASENSGGMISVEQCGRPDFVNKESPEQIDIDMAQDGLSKAKIAIASGEYDLIVLDEINVAVDFKLIAVKDVIEVMESIPQGKELILTGRYCIDEFIEVADLVTEMKEIKHYYQQGVSSRQGFEY